MRSFVAPPTSLCSQSQDFLKLTLLQRFTRTLLGLLCLGNPAFYLRRAGPLARGDLSDNLVDDSLRGRAGGERQKAMGRQIRQLVVFLDKQGCLNSLLRVANAHLARGLDPIAEERAAISPDKLSRDWGLAVRALGLPSVTFHALRHTHASVLIAAGTDILTISRRLGHGSPAITLGVYGHLFSNTDAAAADVIEAAMGTRGER